MGVKHSVSKVSGDRGHAAEWNADHVIDGNVDYEQHQALNFVAENRTTWPAGPAAGRIVFRTDSGRFEFWNGSAWNTFMSPATIIVAADGSGHFTDIQDGIDALPATGGVVYVKDGVYVPSATITVLKSNVAVIGAGPSTIVRPTVNITAFQIGDNVTSISNVLVADLAADGTNTTNRFAFLSPGKVSDIAITGCYPANFVQGVRVIGVGGLRVVNCRFSNVFTGVYASGISTPLISGNIVQQTAAAGGGDGIYLDGGDRITITSNLLVGGGPSGIGIFIRRTSYGRITSNYIASFMQEGIRVQRESGAGGYRNVITDNTLYHNCQQANDTFSEAFLTGGCMRNVIDGNVIEAGGANSAKYCIREDAAADDRQIITSNVATGAVTGQVSTSGPNTIADDNMEA